MLVDWDALEREYDRDLAKDFFQSILTNMEKELVGVFLQDFLSSVSGQNLPNNKRLFLLMNLLSMTPKYAFPALYPPESFQNWILSIVVDTLNVTSSLRCVGLAILLILMKNMRKDSLKLTEIGNAISCNILEACVCLSTASGDENFQLGRLLLRQCVDNLSSITDESSLWTQPIGGCVFDVCLLLRTVSVTPPLFQGSGQFLVDLCKLFSKVVTIWFAQCQPPIESDETHSLPNVLSKVPASQFVPLFRGSTEFVFQLINSQPSLVHDAFQSAFHSALELSYRNSCVLNDRESFNGEVVRDWVDRISQVIETLLGSPPAATEGDHSMDLGRLESLLLLLGCVLGLRAELSQGGDPTAIQTEVEASWVTASRLTFDLIARTMARLKSLISCIPPKKQKMFRSLASNVRKAGIALAEIALVSCPLVLRCPRLGDPTARNFVVEEFISSFCLKTLSTPSLFPQIYRALTIPAQLSFDGFPSSPEEVDSGALTRTIVKHLSTGLRQVAQYSMPAAIDLIATVDELTNAGCVEIISFSAVDLPLSVLTAFAQLPKSGTASSSSSEDISEWKSQCLVSLLSILELSLTQPSMSCTDQFLHSFVDRVPQMIRTLHQCLGNISSRALKLDTPSARDKIRKDALASVTSSLGTTNTEELMPLLQNLIELLNKYLDVISSSSTPHCISPQIYSSLLELFTFLSEICHRPLIFEDDCSLLCSEIDLMGKLASLLDHGGEPGECGTLFPFRDSFRGKLQELDLRVGQEGDSFADHTQTKMIRDICQLHLESTC
jgi:hypothetical protein